MQRGRAPSREYARSAKRAAAARQPWGVAAPAQSNGIASHRTKAWRDYAPWSVEFSVNAFGKAPGM
jgi:hypothetical protein